MYTHISQLLLLYKTWRYYNKFDSTKSLGVYYWCVKIPQCRYMENGLKYITFYVQKHIVHLVMYYDTLLVHDKPLGAPTFVKLLNCDCICVLKNTVVESVQRICSSIKWHWSHGQLMTAGSWFNMKMSSYQYRKSHCGDKTVVRSSYLHNGISYTGKMSSLYWIGAQVHM